MPNNRYSCFLKDLKNCQCWTSAHGTRARSHEDAEQAHSCFSRWFLGSVQQKVVAFGALRSGYLYDALYYSELMAPSFRGSISRMEWNLKWGFLKIHSGPLILQENDRERAKPVSICLNIWPFWLVSTKLAAANHVSKISDHFSVWLQSDRIFCQSYCTRTILVYVWMDPLGACNGALFHGPTALSLISWSRILWPR